jgi:hypothetical protein
MTNLHSYRKVASARSLAVLCTAQSACGQTPLDREARPGHFAPNEERAELSAPPRLQ